MGSVLSMSLPPTVFDPLFEDSAQHLKGVLSQKERVEELAAAIRASQEGGGDNSSDSMSIKSVLNKHLSELNTLHRATLSKIFAKYADSTSCVLTPKGLEALLTDYMGAVHKWTSIRIHSFCSFALRASLLGKSTSSSGLYASDTESKIERELVNQQRASLAELIPKGVEKVVRAVSIKEITAKMIVALVAGESKEGAKEVDEKAFLERFLGSVNKHIDQHLIESKVKEAVEPHMRKLLASQVIKDFQTQLKENKESVAIQLGPAPTDDSSAS